MLEITDKQSFTNETHSGAVLVDFYAPWCAPCKMLARVLEEFSNEVSEVKVVKVNVEELKDIADEHDIMQVPTVLLFKDGNVVGRNTGFMPKEALQEWVSNTLSDAI